MLRGKFQSQGKSTNFREVIAWSSLEEVSLGTNMGGGHWSFSLSPQERLQIGEDNRDNRKQTDFLNYSCLFFSVNFNGCSITKKKIQISLKLCLIFPILILFTVHLVKVNKAKMMFLYSNYSL